MNVVLLFPEGERQQHGSQRGVLAHTEGQTAQQAGLAHAALAEDEMVPGLAAWRDFAEAGEQRGSQVLASDKTSEKVGIVENGRVVDGEIEEFAHRGLSQHHVAQPPLAQQVHAKGVAALLVHGEIAVSQQSIEQVAQSRFAHRLAAPVERGEKRIAAHPRIALGDRFQHGIKAAAFGFGKVAIQVFPPARVRRFPWNDRSKSWDSPAVA